MSRDLNWTIMILLFFSSFLQTRTGVSLLRFSGREKASAKRVRGARHTRRGRRLYGRTIRKVMRVGGEGNFRAAGIVFRYQIPCMNFFRPWHEYFLGLIGVHEFFFI